MSRRRMKGSSSPPTRAWRRLFLPFGRQDRAWTGHQFDRRQCNLGGQAFDQSGGARAGHRQHRLNELCRCPGDGLRRKLEQSAGQQPHQSRQIRGQDARRHIDAGRSGRQESDQDRARSLRRHGECRLFRLQRHEPAELDRLAGPGQVEMEWRQCRPVQFRWLDRHQDAWATNGCSTSSPPSFLRSNGQAAWRCAPEHTN